MSWLTQYTSVVWFVLAVLLALIEVLTVDFVLLMLAGGALAGGIVSLVGAPWPLSVLAAAATAILLVLLVRPVLLRRVHGGPLHVTGTARLVGHRCEVLEPVDDRQGLVRLAGESWTARGHDGERLSVGESAVVVRIDGATAVVSRERVVQTRDGHGTGTGQS